MGRPNTILVGSVLLAASILGVDGYVFFRACRRSAGPPPDAPAPRPEVAQEQPAAAALPRAPDPPPPPVPVEPVAPDPTPPPPAPPDGTGDVASDPTLQRRQDLLLQRRGQVIQAADERVFDILKLPDAARALIRAADDTYVRSLQSNGDPHAEQTRRAAISNILDSETMRAFSFAERNAERRARNQYRPEVVRGR
jgi:type IV secretory pathway VirB10-like protein